jgi:hypothetical protein
MNNAEIVIGIAVAAGLASLGGRYWSRQKLLMGRQAVATGEIVKELPEDIDRTEAENVLRVIGNSFGLKPEILRLNDSFADLAAMDSWTLGKGQDELEQWLRANGVVSLQSKPQTIRDLIVSILQLNKNNFCHSIERCASLQRRSKTASS